MTTANLVKVSDYLTKPEDAAPYGAALPWRGAVGVADSVSFIRALAQKEFLVEVRGDRRRRVARGG
jgi:hypothetical protein